MTTRDQFEDAFEDAESDHQGMKIIPPKDTALQSNGHVVQGTGPENINGDLPESESANYQASYTQEQNGDYDEDEYYDEPEEGGPYEEDRSKDPGNLDNEFGQGVKEGNDQYLESEQYEGEGFQERENMEGGNFVGGNDDQYSDQGEEEPSDCGGEQYKEDDQYLDQYSREDDYEGNDGYTEEDQYYDEEQQYSEDHNRPAEAQPGGPVDHISTEETRQGDYDGNVEGDDAYEYTEDDAYNHANYANDKEDSPPEDVSESDQFIDNPDIDEFRPAAYPFGYPSPHLMDPDDRQYEFHDPELKEQEGVYEDSGIVSGENSTDLGNNAHHSDVELDIPENQEVEKDSPLPEEDSKDVLQDLAVSPRIDETESLEKSKDDKGESDSTEADQQREESKDKAKPERPVSPSKTVKEIKPRPENSMQYKESKELESILHSNLDALTSKKVKVEEVAEPSPEPEPEDSVEVQTKQKPSSQAIPKQGPPKSAKGQQQGTGGKPGPHQSRPSGGSRRQAGTRPAKGKAPPGSRSAPRVPRNEVGGIAPMNQGKGPERMIGGERPDPSTGRRAPGSAKPASALKSMVQSARQEIQNLDSILVASTENSADERENGMRSPERVQRQNGPMQKGLRHSMEYAAPADMLQGAGSGISDEPRNNSNGNHLRRPNSKSKPKRPRSAYFPSAYTRIEGSAVSTPGEVVFDDIPECNAYLREKEHSMGQRFKSDSGHRRRRNSYELANRESSEEENDPYNSYFPSSDLIPGHTRSNHEVFARLEDDYGADDSGNADDLPDSTQPSVTSDVSTPSTPGSQSNNGDQKPKLPPGINPLDYDVVGLRLAEPLDDSSLSINSMSAQPVPDQFSDAEEEDGVATPSIPAAVAPHLVRRENVPLQQSPRRLENDVPRTSQPPLRQPRGEAAKSPKSPPPQRSPTRQFDIGKTMEELKNISETSKSAMSKVPTFYVPEDNKSSPWVLQPGVAIEQEKQERMRRHKIEMQRREQEYQQIQRRQREELHQKQDPQCYIRRDEDETEADSDSESRNLMDADQPQPQHRQSQQQKQTSSADMRAPDLPPTTGKIKEARGPHDEKDLKNGIRYQAAYLGSTQLITTKQPTRKVRMQQAQEAVNRIKAPEGEEQPSKEVDLAISNERIQVLNADSQETMMDHPLKTISYIADIGNIVVIMARRRSVKTLDEAVEESGVSVDGEGKRQPRKIICHVFETEDAQLIAQTIGQAFALAYLEFLKVNGIDDAHVHEMDYHDVLNSQEIYGDDLMLFSNKECEKEALVEKVRGEIMGMVIVESGWGSLIPTVVVANMSPFGAAARSGKLNIGDQIMAINGTSLVGLPLHECQNVIKSLKSQALVKFNIVSCPPVTQVLIKRPDTKYQLGFSVQNGIICSLMRGGIAERGGVRVGHRIIEINGTSVVATPHEKIVDLLSTSVGEIRMKTMPLSMYKLLTGQEQPVYI